jgi:hypothetical protein
MEFETLHPLIVVIATNGYYSSAVTPQACGSYLTCTGKAKEIMHQLHGFQHLHALQNGLF